MEQKVLVQNKKARHDYFITETIEAGIELCGTEVKSLRASRANLKDSYVEIKNGEAILLGMHISPYEQGNLFNRDPLRPRRLLLHKREINRLFGLIRQDGLTLVPLSLYFKGSHIKVELAVAKGKKLYDKRESAAQADAKRQMERAVKLR